MALFINLAGDMPVFQKAFFRNLVAIVMSYIMLAKSPEKFRIKKGSWPDLLMRAGFGTIGVIANFYAISNTNMSDAMMLNKLSPFFAMLTSIIVLKEAADGFQWAAILTAIAGAVFVVKPTFLFGSLGVSGEDMFPLAVALTGGICAGIAYTFLRRVTLKGERGIVVVAFFSTFSCIALIPFIIFTYQPITLIQFFFCCMTGVAACFRTDIHNVGICGLSGKRDIDLRLFNGHIHCISWTGIPWRDTGLAQHSRIRHHHRRIRAELPL